MKKTFLIIFLFLLSTAIFAQTFGLRMGMTLNEVRNVCGRIAAMPYLNNHYLIEPPRRSPLFSRYYVYIHPSYGLYRIEAFGNKIYTDGKGQEVRAAFYELVDTISITYGKYSLDDYIDPNSALKSEDDWMISLISGDRLLYAEWEKEKGANLPDDISQITVSVLSSSNFDGFLTIQYYSPLFFIIVQEEHN
jgi:hypothetical protein